MTSNEEPLDLAAIRARVDAATPAPWWREGDNQFVYGMRRDGRPNGEGIATASYYGRTGPDAPNDAEFIAHARTDVPALLDALAAAQADLAASRAVIAATIEHAEAISKDAEVNYEEDNYDAGARNTAELLKAHLTQSPADALTAHDQKVRADTLEEAATASRQYARSVFMDAKYGRDLDWVAGNLMGGGEHVIRALTPPDTTPEISRPLLTNDGQEGN